MDAVADILNAISTLLWPLLVFFVVVKFSPAVRAIIESARSRKFTLKVGGQELTMEEASQQQQSLIADLQTQVSELQQTVAKILESQPHLEEAEKEEHLVESIPQAHKILWVDDNPKNNSYFLQILSEAGIGVDLAFSTEEGLRKIRSRKYRVVISDMGRQENGKYNPVAGLDLLKQIRARDKGIPFVLYCSRRKADEFKEEAEQLGATAVLSSPTAMMGVLRNLFPELVQ